MSDVGCPATVVAVTRHTAATLLTVALLVVAGCSAPSGPSPTPEPATDAPTDGPTATPTPTPDGGITVYGDLSVNATLVWNRVESILGGEYDPPAVSVRDGALEPQAAGFAAHLGLDRGVETFDKGRVRASYFQRTGRVRISPRNGSTAQVTRILAHEYVHAVQFRQVDGNRTEFLDRISRRDSLGIQRTLIEGSAVAVEDAYTREYLGFSAIERRCTEYRNGTPYERYAGQAYCFGGRYFAETLDSPSEVLTPNTTLPNTTEQLLHPETTGQPANLTVVDETPTDWHTPASFDRQGELFVRTVLGTELPEERAAEAAAGWGNDRLVTVTGDTEGYIWVLRWDSDADAAEFERAFADYLDARGNRTADGWRAEGEQYRLTAVDDRTVAVVIGNGTFLDAVTVTQRDGKVSVSTES
mgnify:CR=1 FL=1